MGWAEGAIDSAEVTPGIWYGMGAPRQGEVCVAVPAKQGQLSKRSSLGQAAKKYGLHTARHAPNLPCSVPPQAPECLRLLH